jgi:hypothetical protein
MRSFICILPEFRLAIHNGDAVLLLGQFLYRRRLKGDSFTFNQDAIKTQTGLGYDAQRTARGLLKSLGILSEYRKGIPCKTHYTIHIDVLAELLEPHLDDALTVLLEQYGVTGEVQKMPFPSVTDHTPEQEYVETPKSPFLSDMGHVPEQGIDHSQRQYVDHTQRQAISTCPMSYKEEELNKKVNKKEEGEQPKSDAAYIPSSEDRFAEEMRQRANGTYSSPFSPEKSEQLNHLRQTIGTQNASYRQVKDNWQRWYSEFSREFIETAWQLSKSVAKRTGKKRLWTFIDLFEDFGQYPQLKQHVRIDDNSLNVPRLRNFSRADDLYSEGEQVLFEGKLYTIIDADEVFLELEDADGNFAHNIFPKWVQPAHAALAGD